MHTVLGVDLQAWIAASAVADNFIHPRRAVTLLGRVVQRQVDLDRDGWVFQGQMAGLIFFMIGVGDEHRGQLVETDHTVRLGILDLRAFGCFLQLGVIRLVVEGPRRLASEQVLSLIHI